MSQTAPLRRLAHLGAVGGRDQRRRQPEELGCRRCAGQLDAVDDIAPLVRAAHLQPAAGAAGQLEEVVGLEDHVVELEEGQRLLAVEAQLDAVEGQHAVDGEVAADLAQERYVLRARQPFVIVEHDGVGGPVAEDQEALEHPADAGDVGLDSSWLSSWRALVLAAGVADLGRPAAHQHDRLVPGLLQPAQHHDLDERADVQRRRRGVEADVGRDDLPSTPAHRAPRRRWPDGCSRARRGA